MFTPRVALISVIVCSLTLPTLRANPNHKDPEAFLGAHGTEEVHAMYTTLVGLAKEVFTTMEKEFEAAQQGRLKILSGKKVAETRMKQIQMLN